MQMDSRSDADVLEEAKGCPIHQLNPMHPALLKQPWGMNSRLRQEAPIFQDPGSGIFFVSRYEDVVKMAMDHKTFSSVMLNPTRALSATSDEEIKDCLLYTSPSPRDRG